MLNLTKFRANLVPIFQLSDDTGLKLEVSYKKRVYEIELTRTSRKTHHSFKRKTTKIPIIISDCPYCKNLMMNEICLYSCPDSLKKTGPKPSL